MGEGLNNGASAYLKAGGARGALLASLPGEALRHGGKEMVKIQSPTVPCFLSVRTLQVFPFYCISSNHMFFTLAGY